MKQKLINTDQKAKQLGVSRRTLYRWVKCKRVKPVYVAGKTLYRASDK